MIGESAAISIVLLPHGSGGTADPGTVVMVRVEGGRVRGGGHAAVAVRAWELAEVVVERVVPLTMMTTCWIGLAAATLAPP